MNTTTNQVSSRQPKGTSEGGQFAPSTNPEATVELAGTCYHPCGDHECATCGCRGTSQSEEEMWRDRAQSAEFALLKISKVARNEDLSGADIREELDDILDDADICPPDETAEHTLNRIVELARTPNLSGADVVQILDEILVGAGFDVDWVDEDPEVTALDQGPSPEDAWIEKFKPRKNQFKDDAPYEGTMYETFGEELEYIQQSGAENCVWTLIEGDDGSFISPGYHLVNRMGYFITEEPWNDQTAGVDLRDGTEYCRDCDGTNSVPCTEDGTELLDGNFDDADYRRCTDCDAVRPN